MRAQVDVAAGRIVMRLRVAFLIMCTGLAALIGGAAVSSSVAAQQPLPRPAPRAEPDDVKRVLLLHSFGPGVKPWSDYSNAIRAELGAQTRWPLDLYEHSVVTARFGDAGPEAAFVEYLRAVFAEQRLDLIVSVGAPAAAFVQRHRHVLFPTTPMLLTVVDQRRVQYSSLAANDTVVAVAIDYLAAFENILRVLPDTKTVAVVVGTSPIEQFWKAAIADEIRPLASRIAVKWYDDLSFAGILRDAAALPPNSAIFWELMVVDAAGVPHEEGRALSRLHAVANAPIFSYTDAFFNGEIVGGPHVPVLEVGKRTGEVAVRILGGEDAGSIKTPPVGFATPKFDFRAMQRWGISESVLPPASEVRFRDLSIWQQYRWHIAGVVVALLLQAALISGLLYERWRRLRSEASAHEMSGRLIHAQEDERARLARELHDDVTQRLALLAIEAGSAERRMSNSPDGPMRTMREGLVRLSEDVHALSYRLHPSVLEDLGLIEAVRSECERFARTCDTDLRLDVAHASHQPRRDVALCVFRIVQEALRNIARHSEATRADISLRQDDGRLRLTVRDDGVGFDPEARRERVSLGLASMRQRAFLLGGTVTVESRPGRGTTILATIPIKEASSEPPPRAVG
jgi:signal transduction histidine kinase